MRLQEIEFVAKVCSFTQSRWSRTALHFIRLWNDLALEANMG